MAGFTTKAVHTPFLRKDANGALLMPVYETAAFEFDSAEAIEDAFLGRKPQHAYTRITNPTVEHFEQKVKHASGALGAVAVSSGMAAIAAVVMALARSGDNIITTKYVFGNTYSLFERTLAPWGLEVRYADLTRPDEVETLIDGNTRAVFLETITNPQMEVVDIKALSAVARKHGVPVIADTTVTPLYLFDGKAHGVDVEVLSSTKYISGGATSVGGLILDNGTFDWKRIPKLEAEAKGFGPFTLLTKLKREVFRNLGSCLSPHNAYLQSIGIETLALRADRCTMNALGLARYLKAHPKVAGVRYPGLEDFPGHAVAKAQFNGRFGSILTFDLASKEECFRVLNGLRLVRRATNVHDNKTLAIHPSSTIFCEYPAALKREMGVPDTMIRLSAGIEDLDDITGDLAQALEER